MNKIAWIASWPKSGSTWVRMWLEAYISGQEPDMLRPMRFSVGDRSPRWYQAASVRPLTAMTPLEVAMLRPAALLNGVAEYSTDVMMKTHAARSMMFGVQQVPGHLTSRALYLVRDPRDIAVSWAHHNGFTIDEAIDSMTGECVVEEDGIPCHVGPWNDHIDGWMGTLDERMAGPDFPVTVLRYEDLLDHDPESWSSVLHAAGIEWPDLERMEFAWRNTVFGKLQDAERFRGFSEAKPGRPFFRRGIAGAWQDSLTPEQADRIERAFRELMIAFGYLSIAACLTAV